MIAGLVIVAINGLVSLALSARAWRRLLSV